MYGRSLALLCLPDLMMIQARTKAWVEAGCPQSKRRPWWAFWRRG